MNILMKKIASSLSSKSNKTLKIKKKRIATKMTKRIQVKNQTVTIPNHQMGLSLQSLCMRDFKRSTLTKMTLAQISKIYFPNCNLKSNL